MYALPSTFCANRTAVITGSARGIGRALAKRLRATGMNLVLIDLPGPELASAVRDLEAIDAPGRVIGTAVSVADERTMNDAAHHVISELGTPTLLVNNAVSRSGSRSCLDTRDWAEAIDINVMGVMRGVSAYAPAMVAANEPAFIVNVGSKQGITNPPGHPVYNACKAAIKSYTESLAHELRNRPDCRVSAHLLIPGFTSMGLDAPMPGAWTPDQVVDRLLDGLARGSFYILCPDGETTPEMDRKRILWSAGDIVDDRPALSRWHADYRSAFETFEP